MTVPRTPRGRAARKRFGQNFLEPAWVAKVVRAIDPRPPETFIEIGPGRGALTRELTARAKAVIAYEIDRDLAAELRATAPPNLKIVEGDFLDTATAPPLDALTPRSNPHPNPQSAIRNPQWRVAGNLPYNVASPILFKLVDLYAQGVPITDATVMLQREVADRLLASPATKDYGVLTVLIRHSADVRRLLALPPGAFRPAPKVHSSLVRLTFHAPDPPVRDLAVFRTLVQAVFTRRRKTLANALLALESERSDFARRATARQPSPDSGLPSRSAQPRAGAQRLELGYSVSNRHSPAEALERALIDGSRRPETLSIAEFARLADVYASVWP
jgi:16S rRNA (adenine1518-N6/adenine1519-N6)-dimethyltransferase